MFITEVYKYKHNGIIYVGGNIPEDAEVLETMIILNADEGNDIVRKSDGENLGNSVWLKYGDSQDNYIEIKTKE